MKEVLNKKNGANFYKADLHLHTPADKNFKTGEDLNTVERKKVYAQKYLNKVLQKGIDIMAITDHNDISWLPFFQNLNKEEPYKQIIIFPGLEIASKEGIHLLVLFEPDYKIEKIKNFLIKVGLEIPFSGKFPKPSTKTIDEIFEIIENDYCIEKKDFKEYSAIVIAAHIEKKDSGLLKKLKPAYYKNSSLIVGQINSLYEDLDNGVRNIVEGKDPNYESKCIAVIESSDARALDEIGKRTSYIKLSSASIEGLRQAFLDWESRIKHQSQYHPEKYSHIIAMKIEGGFADGLEIHFNNSLNCIIGGKGTGKSTLLEILKYSLEHKNKVEELNEESAKILQDVFKPGSKVTLIVDSGEMNQKYLIEAEYPFKPVIKNFDTGDILKGLSANKLLPSIDIYRQKEILELSRRQSSQLELIKRFYNAEVKQLDEQKNKLQSKLDQNKSEIEKTKKLIEEYDSNVSNLPELMQKLNKFKNSGIEKDFQGKNIYEKEKEIWDEFEKEFALMVEIFNDLSVREYLTAFNVRNDDFINKNIFKEAREIATQIEKEIKGKILEINSALTSEAIKKLREKWNIKYIEQEAEYRKKLRELKIEKTFNPDEYIKLEQYIRLKEKSKETLQKYRDQLEEKLKGRDLLLTELNSKRNEIYRKQNKICQEKINKALQGILEVKLDYIGLKNSFIEYLTSFKTGVHHQQLIKITEHKNITPVFFAETVRKGEEALIETFGITESAANKLYKKLDDQALFNIEEFEIPTEITIFLNVGSKEQPNYKPTNDLSVGQKCTALLSLILLKNNEPLIIDQPEDDLDKSFIFSDIVAKLRKEKERRQFIIATHDANLAVLGDAEQIIALHSSDKQIITDKCVTGMSIDDYNVKLEVERLLEGGKEAFNKRKEKYGF